MKGAGARPRRARRVGLRPAARDERAADLIRPEGDLYLEWPHFSAVNSLMMHTLHIRYSPVPYRVDLPEQLPVHRITYTGTLAKRTAEADGYGRRSVRS